MPEENIKFFTVLSIENLTREATTGVVKEVEWVLTTMQPRIAVNKTGTLYLTGSSSDNGFIPFDNLRYEDVLGWVTGSVDIPSLTNELSSSFLELVNQTSIQQTPW